MIFRISAQVVVKESGIPLPDLVVKAYDKDLLFDDVLGNATTDREGRVEILYEGDDFRELFETRPDIYLRVMDADWNEIFSTEGRVRFGSREIEHFQVELPWERVPEALRDTTPDPNSVQLIRDVLAPGQPGSREYLWQGLENALAKTSKTHTSVSENLLLEVAVGLESPIRLAEGSDLPSVMSPEDSLRAMAIEQLARWTGSEHRAEIEASLSQRKGSTLYGLAMDYFSGQQSRR